MSKRLFRYLDCDEHARTWVQGGRIPIKPAGSYLSEERNGILTPDERLVDDMSDSLESLGFQPTRPLPNVELGNCEIHGVDLNSFFFKGTMKNVVFHGPTHNGLPVADFIFGSRYEEEGLVLCFTTELSIKQQVRFNKRCCVQVIDFATLKRIIDYQIGPTSKFDLCRYTDDHRRHPFLKSRADEWQKEARCYWPNIQEEVWVDIPAGLCRLVDAGGQRHRHGQPVQP